MTLLSIQNLSVAFGQSHAVRDVSLTLEKGELLALVGESGSGKSLTALSILKLLPPEARMTGRVDFDGETISERTDAAIAKFRGNRIGMIFQEPMTALNPLHTIDRQILEPLRVHRDSKPNALHRSNFDTEAPPQSPLPQEGRASSAKKSDVGHSFSSRRGEGASTQGSACANAPSPNLSPLGGEEYGGSPSSQFNQKLTELYEAVGLSYLRQRGTRYPHQLSGGERQRAMIAMAIACNPDLLIADEPTTALDVTLQIQILKLIKQLQTERGMGILLITHDLTVVRKIADRVAVMRQGEIVETAPTAQLFANPQHDYTRMLINAHPKGAPAPLAADAPEILTATLRVDFPVKTGLLRRTTRTVTAVDDIALNLKAGETLGIVGESGSGKSSLAYALLKLIQSTGPILFMGSRIDQLSQAEFRPLRRSLQIVFQDPYSSLNPRMTVGEIVGEGLRKPETRNQKPEKKTSSQRDTRFQASDFRLQVSEILTQVGLSSDMIHRFPHEFSGGQRQRIAIARAMILKPALVILDEPTSALDMSVQVQVLELLQQIQRDSGVSYLFISHDLRTVRAMAHRVLVMQHGRMVEQGPAEQIFTHPQQDYTKALMHAAFGDRL